MRMESRKMVLMSLFAKQLGGADIKTDVWTDGEGGVGPAEGRAWTRGHWHL